MTKGTFLLDFRFKFIRMIESKIMVLIKYIQYLILRSRMNLVSITWLETYGNGLEINSDDITIMNPILTQADLQEARIMLKRVEVSYPMLIIHTGNISKYRTYREWYDSDGI